MGVGWQACIVGLMAGFVGLAEIVTRYRSDPALLGTELVKTRHDAELTPDAKMRATIVQLAKYLGADLVDCVLTNAHEVFVKPSGATAAIIVEAAKKLTDQAESEAKQGPLQSP
jgi:hypothetical protein